MRSFNLLLIAGLISLVLNGCSSDQEKGEDGVILRQYQYDNMERLRSILLPDAKEIRFKYNSHGQPIEVIYPDEVIRYGYDANGNRIWMETGRGRTEYRYDPFNRLIGVDIDYHNQKRKIRYRYDDLWNKVSDITILEETKTLYHVEYKYNILGNLIGINNGDIRVRYEYRPERREVIRHLPNGIKTISSYSSLGELRTIKHIDPQDRLIASYRYEYLSPGMPSKIIENGPQGIKTTIYEWDDRGYPNKVYLPDGNTINYRYDNFNRLIQTGEIQYEWDRHRNLISSIKIRERIETRDPLKTEIRYRYNDRGLPISITTPDTTIRYQWDGDGNMISRGIGGDITHYLPDPLTPSPMPLAEFNRDGRLDTAYIYADTLIGMWDRDGNMQYFLGDGINPIQYITDINGRITGWKDHAHLSDPVNKIMDISVPLESPVSLVDPYYPSRRGLYDPLMTPITPSSPLSPMGGNAPSWRVDIPYQDHQGVSWMNQAVPLEDYGLYDPLRDPFKTLWDTASIPLPSITGLPSIMGGIRSAMEGEPWDITLPVSTSYLLGGIATEGLSSAFTFGLGLHQAPLISINLILKPLLHSYWNFVFDTMAESDVVLKRPDLSSYYPPDIYDIDVSKEGDRTTITVKTKRYPADTFPPCHWCGDGGPGGPGGQSGGRHFGSGNPFIDPFKSIDTNLGGIRLDATAQFSGSLGDIKGAVYDPQRGIVVLIRDKGTTGLPYIKPEDLAVALTLVYKDRPQDPQFSLDPADPQNPRGKWLKAVYIPEEVIKAREWGRALFDADWLLKQYAFGVTLDNQGNIQERHSKVARFKSTKEIMFELRSSGGKGESERWARYWIVSDAMILKESDNAIYFDTARMRVRAKRQVPDPTSPTGLRDVDTDDPVATRFAGLFTDLYGDIAKESPEFERVRQLAKAVALAKWMKKRGIRINTDWVNEYLNKGIETVDRVTAISVEWKKEEERPFQKGNQIGIQTITHTLHIFGGVDLTVRPQYIKADKPTQELAHSVITKLNSLNTPLFNLTDTQGKTTQAVVLPVTKMGEKMWEERPAIELDHRGKVAKITDKMGNTTQYLYDTTGELSRIRRTNKDGGKIYGKRQAGGSVWTVTDPKGNRFTYTYDRRGYLKGLKVNQEQWVTYQYKSKDSELTIRHKDYTERIAYDHRGGIRGYEVVSTRERLRLVYNDSGRLTGIRYNDKPLTTKPLLPSITYHYSGKDLTGLLIEYRGREIEYQIDRQGRIRSITIDRDKGIGYSYDDKGRLSAIHLADGRWIEYRYTAPDSGTKAITQLFRPSY